MGKNLQWGSYKICFCLLWEPLAEWALISKLGCIQKSGHKLQFGFFRGLARLLGGMWEYICKRAGTWHFVISVNQNHVLRSPFSNGITQYLISIEFICGESLSTKAFCDTIIQFTEFF